MTENSRMFRNKEERNEESWNHGVSMSMVKRHQKNNERKLESDKFLKRILGRK